MGNLGIALGAGAQAFQNSFASTLRMIDAVRDMREKEALSDALKNLPKEGDEIPLSDQAANEAIGTEARRLGLQVDPNLPRADAIQALNAARRSRGEGDFALPSAGRYTREQVDAEAVRRLRASGSLRGLQLATELERSNLQNQQARMELSRRGWADNLLRARAALAGGDMAGAAQYAAKAYSYIDDGNSAIPRMEGNHAVLDIVGPSGQMVRSLRFDDPKHATEVIDGMLNYATPENYAAFVQRVFQAEQNDKNRATQLQTATIGANATLGAAAIGANSRLAAARLQVEANAPYRDAQIAHFRAQTDTLLQGLQRDRQIDELSNEFSRLLVEDPFNPRLAEIRSRIMTTARDPSRWETKVTERNADGVPIADRVVNRMDAMIASARQNASPEQRLAAATRAYDRLLQRNPSQQQLERFGAEVDQTYGPGTWARITGQGGSGGSRGLPAAPADQGTPAPRPAATGLPVQRPVPSANGLTPQPDPSVEQGMARQRELRSVVDGMGQLQRRLWNAQRGLAGLDTAKRIAGMSDAEAQAALRRLGY